MKISSVTIRNFRRLQDVKLSLEDDNTLLVGPNNSGKTSLAAAFRRFFRPLDFSVHDFTVPCVDELNKFGNDKSVLGNDLPFIEMDLSLSFDPDIEFGRVFALISQLGTIDKAAIRLRYCVKDDVALRAEYRATFSKEGAAPVRPISHFLSLPTTLSRHFAVKYFALEEIEGKTKTTEIEPEEGKRVLHSLVRIDFIDAQRNIHDQESGRHNRLSTAFAAYYKHNLEAPTENEIANKVIDENNARLTEHYEVHFKKLLGTIAKLGVPSAHDRTLRLVSSLSAQEALQGNTELFYVDAALQHELPEGYNGLGFKNLVYMAIQISHYHAQWIATEDNRELCQLIFVEEPEVHLHAQVQQTFISNIWTILAQTAAEAGEPNLAPQLVVSTHSSHIVDTVPFDKIRYFRRSPFKSTAAGIPTALNATQILNLKDFRPVSDLHIADIGPVTPETSAQFEQQKKLDQAATLDFLQKYLRLTHCDLFFADAAVLVEGAVEKLLLPQMICACAATLQFKYLTVLDIGGAYAHKFSGLLAFLGIPYIVITDIDTVDPNDARKACRADTLDAGTSNAALKSFLKIVTRADLIALKTDDQIVADGQCFVTFQRPSAVKVGGAEYLLHGRTLEETFVYENLALFQTGLLAIDVDFALNTTTDAICGSVYSAVRDQNFKKTNFALSVLSSSQTWLTPSYIEQGLKWLESKLSPQTITGLPNTNAMVIK